MGIRRAELVDRVDRGTHEHIIKIKGLRDGARLAADAVDIGEHWGKILKRRHFYPAAAFRFGRKLVPRLIIGARQTKNIPTLFLFLCRHLCFKCIPSPLSDFITI